MAKPLHEMSSWDATSQAWTSQVPVDEWQATRAQTALATQVMRDRDDEAAGTRRDIGRRIDDSLHELFVSCDPAEAIEQQLDLLRPQYIAVHDIGTASSQRLIAGLAAASGRGVQRLVIRRQGMGIALATIEFAEVPVDEAQFLRVYTTQVDSDTQSRHEIARLLLGYSRLAAVMVGDLPPHAMASSLEPLREAIHGTHWHNDHVLMLPLASASTLAGGAAKLGRMSAVTVRTTPQVTRPSDAWGFITATWNRIREDLAPAGIALPELGGSAPSSSQAPATSAKAAAASPAPLQMQPMPAVPTARDRAATSDLPIQRYVDRLIELDGVVSACVFELASQRPVAHAGARPGPALLASQGSALLAAIGETARSMGLGQSLPEAAVTLGGHHLVLRPVPRHPGLVLHAVLDKSGANLTLARLQIHRLDALFDPAG